jgi:hypothetical protein
LLRAAADETAEYKESPMLSYHSDPEIKARYLARVEGHAAADEIIKGRYWEAGKGCAVGCTVHGASHAEFERDLGIPQMLAWLEDVIFEGLPNRMAKTWPERFLSAIEPGQDLSCVGWQFLHWLLTEAAPGDPDHAFIKDAVKQCAEVLAPLADGRSVDRDAAEYAATIAWAAVEKAGIIQPPSVQSPWIAESAARAAESAALSGKSDAASAERAATVVSAAIARSADYVPVSEKLLELLASPNRRSASAVRAFNPSETPKHHTSRLQPAARF